MLNKYYRCMLNVSWTENNSSHEILALVTCTCRTFVLVPMRKRLCLYFGHMIENDSQRISNAGV